LRALIVLAVVAGIVAAIWVSGQRGRPTIAAVEVTSDEQHLLAYRAASIAQGCAACHGTGGGLTTAIPPLAGKPEVLLRAQLLAFKQDAMPGATIMPRLAKGFSDEELEAVARYFATLQPGQF
jgi:cytochrome subunit of sulfide dehydrogenase